MNRASSLLKNASFLLFLLALASLFGKESHSRCDCFPWSEGAEKLIAAREESIALAIDDERDVLRFPPVRVQGKQAQREWLKENDSRALPFLLPYDHPARCALDTIFQAPHRLVASHESLMQGGKFSKLHQRMPLSLTVASHKKLKGYLIKTFLDTQPPLDELENFIRRIRGAQAIRQAISKHGFEKFFQVPQKWLYRIPPFPLPEAGAAAKHYLLVVEDMEILPPHANQTQWLSSAVSCELLDALYTLLTDEGLYDSLYIDNIPFAKNGKISFIDTEHHHGWPICYQKLLSSLSPGMKSYWQDLIMRGGP